MRTRVVTAVAVFITGACADVEPLRVAVVGTSVAPLGAVLAAEDINAAGGINGRLLELGIVRESETVTPREAIATAESLANDASILAVVGHGGSATSLAAAQVYNARRLPQIAPNTSSPLYTNAGPYSFRLVASDNHQAVFLAKSIAGKAAGRRVCVLYTNDDYGRALNEMLQRALREHGITVTHQAPVASGAGFARDVSQTAHAVHEARADLLVWIGLAPNLTLLRPHLRRMLPQLRVLGSDGVSFIGTDADLTMFDGDWLVAYADVTSGNPRIQSLAARFLSLANRPLTDGAVLTYDAVTMLANAMRAGARTRSRIQEHIAAAAASGVAYDAMSGTIRLDENGDGQPSYVLLEITRAGPVVVGR